MLDFFVILSRGGLGLWAFGLADWASLLNPVLKTKVLDPGLGSCSIGTRTVAWTFSNNPNLIFIVGYQKILQIPYIPKLLEDVKLAFLALFKGDLAKLQPLSSDFRPDAFNFTQTFEKIVRSCEAEKERPAKQKHFTQSKKFHNTLGALKAGKDKPARESSMAEADDEITDNDGDDSTAVSPTIVENVRKIQIQSNQRTSKKEKRTWSDKVSKEQAAALDMSDDKNSRPSGQLMRPLDVQGKFDLEDLSADDSRSPKPNSSTTSEEDIRSLIAGQKKEETAKKSKLADYLLGLSGQKPLSESDLQPFQRKLKEHLIGKNVATDVAESICSSVAKTLVGEKPGAFKSVYSMLNAKVESVLRQILLPKTSSDLLDDIKRSKNAGKTYSIVFVGVNGVGKSTNLSKICFWLLRNGMKVLIAACDTFRSGAVEQLKVHVRNLKGLDSSAVVDLFERGYGKDAASIAKEAVAYGQKNGYDVVLVDTAGRMQDNEPLMRSLAKLVSLNRPDKILFVGEALVGNEALDQLSKFNQALRDFSGLELPRQIDGIILTKFDTIDDKVGAAISMTYTSKAPILFIGTGQTYTDIRTMNVNYVVESLLK